jgi:hypothetical protein
MSNTARNAGADSPPSVAMASYPEQVSFETPVNRKTRTVRFSLTPSLDWRRHPRTEAAPRAGRYARISRYGSELAQLCSALQRFFVGSDCALAICEDRGDTVRKLLTGCDLCVK